MDEVTIKIEAKIAKDNDDLMEQTRVLKTMKKLAANLEKVRAATPENHHAHIDYILNCLTMFIDMGERRASEPYLELTRGAVLFAGGVSLGLDIVYLMGKIGRDCTDETAFNKAGKQLAKMLSYCEDGIIPVCTIQVKMLEDLKRITDRTARSC